MDTKRKSKEEISKMTIEERREYIITWANAWQEGFNACLELFKEGKLYILDEKVI